MQGGLHTQRTVTSTQYNPTQQTDVLLSNPISGLVVILLPVVVVCAIAGHRKYRTTVVRQQIKFLNRLWQLDSNKNLS
ncbi:MAG TPA: hypothetical protein V6D50_25525 [Chroococcales cyanobacterium]|jgi:hypothetical protein